MTGQPYLGRLAFGLRVPKVAVPGMDLAGVVEAVGADVMRFQPGDEVFGIGKGTYAEYARAPESKLALKPAGLGFEDAAALAISGSTALQAVRDHGQVQPGHRVLVIGASGGVGSYAVQLAKHAGAEVTGVCSTAKVELVRSLGADHVVDYTKQGISDAGERYDVILDIGGNTPLARLRQALDPAGTLVIVGGEGGGRWFGGIDRQLRATILSMFVGQRLGTFISRENQDDIEELAGLVAAGAITPAIERTYPLPEAAQAIRHVEAGRARGKVVVTI
jgi:NADPH:quinone reductase-like Zn-dependent oxidoreductase